MNIWMERFKLPEELSTVIEHSPSVIVPESKETLFELIFGSGHAGGYGGTLPQWSCGQFSRGLHAPPGPGQYAGGRRPSFG